MTPKEKLVRPVLVENEREEYKQSAKDANKTKDKY